MRLGQTRTLLLAALSTLLLAGCIPAPPLPGSIGAGSGDNWDRDLLIDAAGHQPQGVFTYGGFGVLADGSVVAKTWAKIETPMMLNASGALVRRLEPTHVGKPAPFVLSDVEQLPDGSFIAPDMSSTVLHRFASNGDWLDESQPVRDVFAGNLGYLLGAGVSADGSEILVADTLQDSIARFSASDLTYLGSFSGTLSSPSDVAVTPDGTIFVTDQNGYHTFDANRTPLASYPVGPLDTVQEMADNTVWVGQASVDTASHYDASGNLLGSFGVSGTADGELTGVTGVQRDPSGDLWMSDRTGRIQRFTTAGAWVATRGEASPGAPRPPVLDVATDQDSTIYAARMSPGSGVARYGADGTDLGSIITSTGGGDGQIAVGGTLRMARSSAGELLVTDTITERVQVFSTAGVFQRSIDLTATLTSGAGAVAGGPSGEMYVCDTGGGAVYRLASDGSVINAIGTGVVDGCERIEVLANGTVYIQSMADSAVYRYTSAGALLGSIAHASLNDYVFGLLPDGSIMVGYDKIGVAVVGTDGVVDEVVGYPTNVSGHGLFTVANATWDAGRSSAILVETDVHSTGLFAQRLSRWYRDTTAPTFAVAGSATASSVTFTITGATDDHGGLHATPYSFDDGATFQASPTYTATGLAASQTVTVNARVRDRYGNVSAAQTSSATTSASQSNGPVRVVVIEPTPTSGIVRNGTVQLRGEGGTGSYTFQAEFRGSRVSIPSSGVLRIDDLPEGRGTLRLVVTDAAGQSAVVTTQLLVDRTAPRFTRSGVRYVVAASAALRVSDALSGPTERIHRVTGLRLGRQRIERRLRDRAGNARTAPVVIERRVSLSRPASNGGIRLRTDSGELFRPDLGTLEDVFGFDGYTAPYYQRTHETGPLVAEVNWRLRLLGFLSPVYANERTLSYPIIEAVQRYQRARGIEALGTVGPKTRRALDADIVRLGSEA